MDGGEMNLGMEVYEQWDWQRFREAESMELEDEEEERSTVQAEIGVENGDRAGEEGGEETREKLLPQYYGTTEESGDIKLRQTGFPQYDGPAEEAGKAASIPKMRNYDIEPTSRQMGLPQYDSPAQEAASIPKMRNYDIEPTSRQMGLPQYDSPAQEAASIIKTGAEDVDVSSRRDDATASTPLPGDDVAKNESEVQEQSAVLEEAEANKDEKHLKNIPNQNREALEEYIHDREYPSEDLVSQRKAMLDQKMTPRTVTDKGGDYSERHDGEAQQRGVQEMNIADDESNSDFLGGEAGKENVVKVGGDSISQETPEENADFKSTAITTASEPASVADSENFRDYNLFEEQINDKIDDPFLGSENAVLERSNDDASSLRKVAMRVAAQVVVDEETNEMNNQPEEDHENTFTLAIAHSEIIEENEKNRNADIHSKIHNHAIESKTSGFLSNQDLRDLEGKPSPITTQDQSPVKVTTRDGSSDEILITVKDTTDEKSQKAADLDYVPALTYAQIQNSSITDQGPVNDDSLDVDDLPPLPRTKAPVHTRHIEIPDSDATTESSQQSSQKLSHMERNTDRMRNTPNAETTVANDTTEEVNENKETEDLASSFGRECITSSIDPKKHLNEPKSMEVEILENVTENSKEFEQSLEIQIVDSAKNVTEDSRRGAKDDMEVGSLSAQTLPQKTTDKRGRPPGRKRSGIAKNEADNEEPVEQKAKFIEADSEKSMGIDTKKKSNASSPMPEKKKRGRPCGRKISASFVDEPATERDPVDLDAPESRQVIDIDKTNEETKETPAEETLANGPSLSSSAPEKKRRGRPSGRKVSTISTATDDDIEIAEREVLPIEDETTQSIVGPKSKDGPDSRSPIHSMQEKKRRGRPAGRKSSNLIPEKKYAEEQDEDLKVPNGVVPTAPSENADDDGVFEPVVNDTMDKMPANSSSPVKRKRGRPTNRKSSELSSRKVDTEEGVNETSNDVPVVLLEEVQMEEATPNHKSIEEFFTISSSSVKKKRGRPSRKSSGIMPEGAEVEDLRNEASSLPQNDAGIQGAATNWRSNDDLADSSPERPRKRGRPFNRKVSELKSQKTVNKLTGEISEFIATEKTPKSSTNEPFDVYFSNEPADVDSSLVKRKRARSVIQTASELSPHKTTVNDASEEVRHMVTEEAIGSGINEPVGGLQSTYEAPPFANLLPEKRKKGRPASRKVSELNSQKPAINEVAGEEFRAIMRQEPIAADTNESPVVDSSPKRKGGSPSGVSPEKQDVVEPVEATLNSATTIVSREVSNAKINDSDACLSVTSSPEKRKRGRPSRKATRLNTGSATKEMISGEVNTAGKNTPTEILDSDEERDELLDEWPPTKKFKPEPRKRGRPSGTKLLNLSTEDAKAIEEDASGEERIKSKGNENMKVDTQNCEEPHPAEKKRRGRPAAAKARRISNSDSEVIEEEKQISEKVKLSNSQKKKPIEVEDDEQEEPVIEKKKRGRPALLKNKGKQTAEPSESADDEDVTMKGAVSTTGNPKGKVSRSQVSTSSNTSPSSQRQDALFAEMKAMKISSIQSRNAQLKSEIAQRREKAQEIAKGLEQPAKETVKRHIKLLHDYNDMKDVGQGLLGMIADNRGVRVGELYGEFGVEITD